MMMKNNSRLPPELEDELSRTIATVLFPSLMELNHSFHRFLNSVNDLGQLMAKIGYAPLQQNSETHAVSHFLYLYQQKINIGLPWLKEEEERVRWNPARIHSLLLNIYLTGKIDPLLNQQLWYAEPTKGSLIPPSPFLPGTAYTPKVRENLREGEDEKHV
ncbi:hypothetical protein [Paenibacillus lautus]|jgi:hypothetical protein|uniref:hypothetical protein n=1 Tax=Paenibacillus lautus TaxID=1401 RepID=UPI0039876867